MAGVGGAIAEGIQGGWQMGLQADAAAEHRREFEAEMQIRRAEEDRRVKQEEDRYGRLQDVARMKAVQDRLEYVDKQATSIAQNHGPNAVPKHLMEERVRLAIQMDDMQREVAASPTARLSGTGLVPSAPQRPNVASADMAGSVPAAQSAGPQELAPQGPMFTPVSQSQPAPTSAQEPAVAGPKATARTPQQMRVANVDQASQDLASRLQTGQASLATTKPGDFALMVASATKRPPAEIGAVKQHVADFNTGMTTGNNGLVMQGLNGVFGPQISQGVGQPSPYGGNVVSKEIVGLDPAMSADGSIHSDKVIPRLKVTTDQTGPDGAALYYHAPLMGQDGKVAAVPMAAAVNHVGAAGGLAELASHPDAQAMLAEGAKDPRVQQYLEDYRLQLEPVSKAQIIENHIQAYMRSNKVDRTTATQAFVDAGDLPWHPLHGVGVQDVAAAQQLMAADPQHYPDLPAALRAVQATTHSITKYSPGAVNTAPAGGGGTGTGLPGSTTSTGELQAPEAFLKKLSSEDRASVLAISRDPSLIANVSTSKNRREHVQNLVDQYLATQDAQGTVHLGTGAAGIDAQGNPIGGIKPDTVDFYATQSIAGDNSWQTGLGRGKVGQALISAVKDRIPAMAHELGLSPQDVGSNKAQNVALSKTLVDRTKYVAAVEQLQGTLSRQAGLVQSLLAKGGATEGGPLFNAPYNKVREALGSVDAKNLELALVGLAREHQRVIVSPLSNGQLAVSAQATGDKLANLNLTPSQIMGAINTMKTEAANAKTQGKETLTGIQSQLSNLGKAKTGTGLGAGSPSPASAGGVARISSDADFDALPSGARFVGPDGHTRVKP